MPAVESKLFLAFLNDGTKLVVGNGRSFNCYDTPRSERASKYRSGLIGPRGQIFAQTNGKRCIDHALLFNGEYIACVFDDGLVMCNQVDKQKEPTVRLSTSEKPNAVAKATGRPTVVKSIAQLPGAHFMAAYAGGESVDIWSLEHKSAGGRFAGSVAGVSAAAILPDGRRALSGYDDGRLTLYELPHPILRNDDQFDHLIYAGRTARQRRF